MKVLVVHNRYRSAAPSGENMMVDAEIELMSSGGITVVPFIRESDSLSADRAAKAEAMIGPLVAPRAVRDLRSVLERERPDVVHLHNVFPLISPWVVRTAHAKGVPVVQTVHNYRHSCVNGLHFRDGHPCVDCLGRRVPYPAVIHRCYRNSRAQTLPMAASQALHRSTWRGVDSFIALTEFMRDKLQQAGIPGESIALRPTWVSDPGPTDRGQPEALFVGRLDENKGLGLLLDAWPQRGTGLLGRLHIVGSGPMADVASAAAAADPSISFYGPLPAASVSNLMRACAVVIVPSTGFEGYPLVIAEAFGHGRPVVTVRGGSSATTGTPETGWVAEATAADMASTLGAITPAGLVEKGREARQYFLRNNSPDAALRRLLEIYAAALGARRSL